MKYFYIALICLLCSCSMVQHEIEREANKTIAKYLRDNFAAHVEKYDEERRESYKEKVGWVLGTSGTTIGIITGIGGVILLKRKLMAKKETK